MTRIFFLGVGHMGGPMAANLAAAGNDVSVFDLDARRIAEATLNGCRSTTMACGAAQAEVVLTSLPGPAQVRAVGEKILALMTPGSTWIDCSTNDLATARALTEPASIAGVELIDAPVSGGPEGAAAASLSVYVGGTDDTVRAAWPILESIGANVDHLGEHGSGYSAKIAQVTLCYTQTITFVEALMLGVKGGVDPTKMTEIIQRSAGSSYVADIYGPEIVAGTYDPTFSIQLAAKDLRLAMEMDETVGADLPFMARVAERYAHAEAHYGPAAPHLLAARLTEIANDSYFHKGD